MTELLVTEYCGKTTPVVHAPEAQSELDSVHDRMDQRGCHVHTGAKVAICEMPFDLVASDQKGGAGGTCVLRGCVPKKLMVYGGEFAQAFKDSQGFG